MATDTLVITEPHAGVRLITLNRPDKRNAINEPMFAGLIDAFQRLDADASVRAAVITGSGTAFCAGVDLGDVSDRELIERRRVTGISPPLVLLQTLTPVIAAINGSCVAGGLELALACDLVVAAEEARFADTHIQLGLLPSWGAGALLPAAVGTRRAKEMSLTGRFVSAAQARDYGLVAEVVPSADLLTTALAIAERIAAADPGKVRKLLQMHDEGEGLSRAERLAIERRILLDSALDVSGAAARGRKLNRRPADD